MAPATLERGIAALAMALDRFVRMPAKEPAYQMIVFGGRDRVGGWL